MFRYASIIFNLTFCGSVKILQFTKCLDISIPRWLEMALIHTQDVLTKSVYFSEQNSRALQALAPETTFPLSVISKALLFEKPRSRHRSNCCAESSSHNESCDTGGLHEYPVLVDCKH